MAETIVDLNDLPLIKMVTDRYNCTFIIVQAPEGFYWASTATEEDEAESDGPFDTAEDAERALLAL